MTTFDKLTRVTLIVLFISMLTTSVISIVQRQRLRNEARELMEVCGSLQPPTPYRKQQHENILRSVYAQ
jgi:hypothetical protein